MPDITPNLGLKKPLGNEHVLRTFYRENLDLIDTNAAKKSDLVSHINAGGTAHAEATETTAGFMTGPDKKVLGTATYAATPNTLAKRDSAGRFKAAAPVAVDDVARKAEVDIVSSLSQIAQARADAAYSRADSAFQSASDGKTAIAAAITGKGVPASGSDTFTQLATSISNISTGSGDAVAADLLVGKTATNSTGPITGTMVNNAGSGILASTMFILGNNLVLTSMPKGYIDNSTLVGIDNARLGTAAISHVITGQSFTSKDGIKMNGTMPSNGSLNYTPSGVAQSIPAGYTSGGSVGAVSVPTGSVLSGTTIAGQSGTMPNNGVQNFIPSGSAQSVPAGYTSGGTVGAVSVPTGSVLTGTTIAGQAGTMPNNGVLNYTPNTNNQYIPAGYTTGGTISGEPNLVAGNIRSGATLFGVTGNVLPSSYQLKTGTTGLVTASSSAVIFDIPDTGLATICCWKVYLCNSSGVRIGATQMGIDGYGTGMSFAGSSGANDTSRIGSTGLTAKFAGVTTGTQYKCDWMAMQF